MVTEKSHKYYCENCDYGCSRPAEYKRHCLTNKHKMTEIGTEKSQNVCECGKKYAHKQGLYRHKKNCNYHEKTKEMNEHIIHKEEELDKEEFKKEMFLYLIKENKEMKEFMMEQSKIMCEIAKNSGNNNNNNSNNNNSNNKTFNLQFFLNETCKNAVNLSDFVKGVVMTVEDLEETGRIGYVNGVSRIFCNELRKLDICERPIHCSDAKRETIYVRENNKWEKDENYELIMDAVKKIARMNVKLIPAWQNKYPGWKDTESKENDRYLNLLLNIMCYEDEVLSNHTKIMQNVIKIAVINKEEYAKIK